MGRRLWVIGKFWFMCFLFHCCDIDTRVTWIKLFSGNFWPWNFANLFRCKPRDWYYTLGGIVHLWNICTNLMICAEIYIICQYIKMACQCQFTSMVFEVNTMDFNVVTCQHVLPWIKCIYEYVGSFSGKGNSVTTFPNCLDISTYTLVAIAPVSSYCTLEHGSTT